MTGGTENRFWIGASCRKFALWLAAAVICSMMMSEQALCCHVIDIYHFEVAGQQSGPWDDSAAVCKCTFWVSLEWLSAGQGTPNYWWNDWIIEIWSPGAPTGPEEDDYRPPSGSMVDSITLPWDIDGNSTGSAKEAVVEFDASSLSVGTHTLRAWIIRDGTSPENAWEYSTTCTVTVVEITSLVWEKYRSDSHDLDTVAGGKRIFPGKKTYNDAYAADRKKVWVKATISPPLGDIPVYFKWIDPDDPSSDDAPIDTNGSAGDDNKGEGEGAGLGPSLLRTLSETTNSGGEAKVVFTVSMQPGDNFIVVAVPICEEYIDDATCAEPTPLLTTWRKLWVERDYMAPVPATGSEKNRITGTNASYTYDPATDRTTVDLGDDMPDNFDDEDQFEGGRYVAGGNTYTVLLYTDLPAPIDDEIVVEGNASGAGTNYTLYDDDVQTWLDSPYYCDFGIHGDGFAGAYIQPNNLPTGSYSDEVAFNLNMEDWEFASGLGWDNEQDVWSSSAFWACLVVTGYQGPTSEDVDPDGWGSPIPAQDPDITWGETYRGDADNAAMVFVEVVHNEILSRWSEGQYVVHEMGHTGGADDHGGTHCYMCMATSDPDHFCDDCIAGFREEETWLTTN